jgi:hypothetical protein
MQAVRARLLIDIDHNGVALDFAPYSYASAQPRLGLSHLFVSAHREFAAAASLAIPDGLRRRLLEFLRG